jgi:hypothetical protein
MHLNFFSQTSLLLYHCVNDIHILRMYIKHVPYVPGNNPLVVHQPSFECVHSDAAVSLFVGASKTLQL